MWKGRLMFLNKISGRQSGKAGCHFLDPSITSVVAILQLKWYLEGSVGDLIYQTCPSVQDRLGTSSPTPNVKSQVYGLEFLHPSPQP